MFTQLYNPRYTQPITAYNSALNKTIHLFKVKDHLYCNIDISVSYINTLPNEFVCIVIIRNMHAYTVK